MTPNRHREIEARWAAIDSELIDLVEGKVMPDVSDPAGREGELLEEQDALEYELGQAYFEDRNADKGLDCKLKLSEESNADGIR